MNRHAKLAIELMTNNIKILRDTIDNIVANHDHDANSTRAAMRIMDIESEIDELEQCIAVLERLA